MRRAASSSIRFAPMLSVLIVPACFSLPKADVSTHVIDDFAEDAGADAGLTPTWGAFSPWTCDAFTIRDQDNGDAGPDGGPVLDAGQPPGLDGVPPVSCTFGPGNTGPHELAATFALAASASNLGVAVATHTIPGSAVDFTGFKYLQFSAKLSSAMRQTNPLPPGTTLEVELGCPAPGVDFVASDKHAGVTVDAVDPSLVKLNLTVTPTDFAVVPSSESIAACLRAVDRIRFIVALPAQASPIAGTLELDDIELTNNN
jgi:hypothetical protein